MINKKIITWLNIIFICLIAVIAIGIMSLSVGSAKIPFNKILSIFLHDKGSMEYSILFDVRWPRILMGFCIGGALSLAGVILQGMFRNPLVEPYTIGISGGAALGVCLNIVFKIHKVMGILSMPFFGFLGAIVVIMMIYFLNIKKGILKIQELLLTGVMLSFICSSFIMLIMSIAQTEDLHGIIFWMMGSLEQSNWFFINLAIFISLGSLAVSYFFSHDLNAFALGEEEAHHLGINTERTKRILFSLAAILVGFSVSIAGIIGFVGLAVPHIMRVFVGRDHRILLISSFLGGAAFLILCDTLSRTIILPMELPVGVITGLLGGTLFVYCLTSKKGKF